MAIVNKPFTFANAGTVTHSDWNTNFDTLYTEFNGNIDDTNIKAGANIHGNKLANTTITAGKLAAACITDSKLDYASVRVLRSGPTPPGVDGVREARGGKAFTLVAGFAALTITFATDSDDGNPAFGGIPRISVGIQTAGAQFYNCHIDIVTALSFVIRVNSTSGADTATGTLHWTAIGEI